MKHKPGVFGDFNPNIILILNCSIGGGGGGGFPRDPVRDITYRCLRMSCGVLYSHAKTTFQNNFFSAMNCRMTPSLLQVECWVVFILTYSHWRKRNIEGKLCCQKAFAAGDVSFQPYYDHLPFISRACAVVMETCVSSHSTTYQ